MERAPHAYRRCRPAEKADAALAGAHPWPFREAATAEAKSLRRVAAPRLRQSRAMDSCEFVAEEWNLSTMKVQVNQGREEDDDSQSEQQPLVSLNFDPEQREMAQDGAGGRGGC